MTNNQIEQRVNLKITNGVAFVCLNRPEKCNALDMAMFIAIKKVIKQLQKDR